ncbi:hypothetical protein ACF0H5_013593 [Mactra antiquata]
MNMRSCGQAKCLYLYMQIGLHNEYYDETVQRNGQHVLNDDKQVSIRDYDTSGESDVMMDGTDEMHDDLVSVLTDTQTVHDIQTQCIEGNEIGIFDVHLDNLLPPTKDKEVRVLNYSHVKTLETSLRNQFTQHSFVVGMVVDQDVSPEKLKTSGACQIQVLGGNYTVQALKNLFFKGLYSGVVQDEDKLKTSFNQTFFKGFSSWSKETQIEYLQTLIQYGKKKFQENMKNNEVEEMPQGDGMVDASRDEDCAKYKVGDKVKAKWNDGHKYDAIVQKVETVYHIEYVLDGVKEKVTQMDLHD